MGKVIWGNEAKLRVGVKRENVNKELMGRPIHVRGVFPNGCEDNGACGCRGRVGGCDSPTNGLCNGLYLKVGMDERATGPRGGICVVGGPEKAIMLVGGIV